MALPFGVSWLHTLLLWGCICFPPQKGYNIAHGYSLNHADFSRHAGVLGAQTPNQFNSGASLNANQDSVSPMDEMQATGHQSFVSLQSDPVHHENNKDASSVTSLSNEVVQSEPDSEHDVPVAPPVPKYEHEDYQHPFGLLVKEHTQENTREGTSFRTIKDFKRFIETMKRSFLMPVSDLGTDFQTAGETMETEMATNAQNIKEEHDTGYRSNSAKEGIARDDASENEVWSEAMHTAFEQSELGANYQMPSERDSVPDPVDSTASLISASDSQDSGLGSAPYPRHHLAPREHVPSNYGSFDSGGISGENPYIFTNGPHVRNEDVQSTSYKLPEEIPSGSFLREDLSFRGHMTAPPVNPPNSPSQDFSDYSSKTSNITPLTSKKNIKHPKYTPRHKDSLTGYQKPSDGFESGKDFQSEELSRATPANVLSAPVPPSWNSYGKSVYVSAPRGQFHIPEYIPTQSKRPAKSFQAYQPTVGKESKGINSTPNTHLPVSTGSLSLNYDNPSPQSSSDHVGVQTSSPHDDPNQAFNRKQPVRFPLMFTVKPASSFDSSRGDGYPRDQTVSISRPSVLTAQTIEENSDLSEQTPVSANQGSKQMADNTLIPISSGLDSTQSGILSQVGVGDVNFNSLTNSAPESAFSGLVGNEVMSRNSELNDIIPDMHGPGNPLGSFSTPLRQGISLNGDYVSATRAGLQQTFMQPTKVRKRPGNVKKEPGNMSYWPPKPLSASKGSASTLSGVFWRNGGNTKRLPPQMGPNMSSPPSVNAYIMKSKNSYVRGNVSLSKTHYAPYLLDEHKNTVSHNVKVFEEQ